MSGRKGMLHYKVEVKQEAVRLVLEEHLRYAVVAANLKMRKAERIEAWVRMYRQEGEISFHKSIGGPLKSQAKERELECLRMENVLLKNSIPNCGGVRLAQRNIGRSTTTRKNKK